MWHVLLLASSGNQLNLCDFRASYKIASEAKGKHNLVYRILLLTDNINSSGGGEELHLGERSCPEEFLK